MDNRPIGVFDSGVGGITVVKALFSQMPNENIVYFGDTARLPYGSKSKEAVTDFAREITRFLIEKNVKAIIVACNTATAHALDTLREEFHLPIFGVIDAGVYEALRATRNAHIGVIGTAGTIKSGVYKEKLESMVPIVYVHSKPCPLFVPLAEEGWVHKKVTLDVARVYLTPLLRNKIDTLILGCTHYPLLKKSIVEVVGKEVNIIDPAKATAKFVHQYLVERRMEISSNLIPKNNHAFYLSDESDMFTKITKRSLGEVYEPTIIRGKLF